MTSILHILNAIFLYKNTLIEQRNLNKMSTENYQIPDFPNRFSNVCFLAEVISQTYKVCKLKSHIQSIIQATFSPIFTLGSKILFHHNQVQPPNFQCHEKTNGKVDASYPCQQLSVNNLFEPWIDYISNLVVEGKVYQQNNVLFLIDLVPQTYLQNFAKSDIFQFFEISKEKLKEYVDSNDFPSMIQKIYNLEIKKIQKKKKFAAVCFASKPPLNDRYIPRVHVSAMFFGLFYRQTDTWKVYKPNERIFPTQEELQNLDGVVLSGSAHSVYENVPEINQFMSMLVKAYKKNENLKILGFCFGHQSIGYAFGGKVQAMKQKVVRLENVHFDSKKIKELQFEWFDRESSFLLGKEAYLVSEYHGDEVVEIPQGFTVIGSSNSCPNQAMVSNDGRCLSFQFHMQYTPAFCGAYELRLKSYDTNIRYGTIYHGSSKMKSCERNLRSIFQLREISRNFLESVKVQENC